MDSTVKPINIEHEQRYISYIIKVNQDEAFYFEKDVFTDSSISALWNSCRTLLEDGIPLTIENIAAEAKNHDSRINKDNIEAIINDYNDFSNPEYIRNLVKGNYIKNKYSRQFIEDVLTDLSSAGEINTEKLKKVSLEMADEIEYLYDKENDLKTSEELIEQYKDDLIRRSKGFTKRSLGYEVLNDIIERPAADGQITTIGALSGNLKSLFTLSIVNNLTFKDVPVLFISPEMTYEQTLDRSFAMKGKINIKNIVHIEEESRIWNKLNPLFEKFKDRKNFMFTDKGGLSIKDVEKRIVRTKTKFRNAGVFKDGDEYIFVVIDLLSMLTDLAGATPAQIIESLDRLLEIAKKYGIHILGVIQANEGQLRENRRPFEVPDDVDNFKLGLGDIKWGSAWRERSRVMMTLTRPLEMKKLYFPEFMDEWKLAKDIVKVHVLKQNEGDLGFCRFAFDKQTLSIYPYKGKELQEEIED